MFRVWTFIIAGSGIDEYFRGRRVAFPYNILLFETGVKRLNSKFDPISLYIATIRLNTFYFGVFLFVIESFKEYLPDRFQNYILER